MPVPDDPSAPVLSQTQRTRLLKSSRKLAKVLGTTPVLQLSPPSPSPRRAHHQHQHHNHGHHSPHRRPRTGAHSVDVLRPAPSEGERVIFSLDTPTPTTSTSFLPSPSPEPAQAGTSQPSSSWPPSDTERAPGAADAAAPPIYRYKMKKSATTDLVPLSPVARHGRASTMSVLSFMTTTSLAPSEFGGSREREREREREKAEREKARLEAKEKKEMLIRRKRMDKLARYLGETPPADLVFQAPHPGAGRWALRKSRSLSILIPEDERERERARDDGARTGSHSMDIERPLPPLPHPASAPRRERLHPFVASPLPTLERLNSAISTPPAHIGEVPIPAPAPTRPTNSTSPRLATTSTERTPRPQAHITPGPRLASLFVTHSRPDPALDAGALMRVYSHDDLPSPGHGHGHGRSESRLAGLFRAERDGQAQAQNPALLVAHRSERRQGWSGEWNAESVQDVVTRLRDLK
ncbi:hypothetical protein DENSPDRAFT_844575 [Dentipellis sp. KUC8613]|nr:hypothetical protein DENSPDRAFT_844575 [Dentipellis sp. KUC8613]